MVYKSKILGKPPIIFITLGTTQFPFNRLYKALDEALKKLNTTPIIFAQGQQGYKWQYDTITSYEILHPKKFISILKKATHIITQAGPGNLYLISQYSKVFPFIIAREKTHSEHINDHQVHFRKFIKDHLPKEYSQYIASEENLQNQLTQYLNTIPKKNILNKSIFNKSDKNILMQRLSNYISKK